MKGQHHNAAAADKLIEQLQRTDSQSTYTADFYGRRAAVPV
jgi:hypothetical protein